MTNFMQTAPPVVEQWQITTLGGVDKLALVLLAVVCIFAAIWTWRSLEPRLPLKYRIGILVMRLFVLVLGFVLLLQPTLRFRKTKPLPSHIAVLLDVSESMSLGGFDSRLAEVKKLVTASKLDFAQLEKKHRISWFGFSDTLEKVDGPDVLFPITGRTAGTDIQGALDKLISSFSTELPLGVLLISDGADTLLADAEKGDLSWVKNLGIPVNTVAITQASGRKDLSVLVEKNDSFAFSRSETPIVVTIKNLGLPVDKVEVKLWQEGSLVQYQEVDFVGSEGRVTFTPLPSKLGNHVYTVTVPVPEGDEVPQNNVAHVGFEVVRDKIRVLHVAGRPSWGQRFLRDTLKDWPKIDLVSFYILRTPYQSTTLGPEGLALIPFPTKDLFENHLDEFDVIIFQDFLIQDVGVDKYLESIEKFVRKGGGFVILGGEQAYGAGVLAKSSMASVLPVKLMPVDGRDAKKFDVVSFRPKITEVGLRHPVLQMGGNESETEKYWNNITRLDGIAMVEDVAQGAVVLAEHPHLQTGGGLAPLVAAKEVEQGRTLAITTDSLWKWRFSGPLLGNQKEVYPLFWNRVISWLTHAPELEHLRVKVTPFAIAPGANAQIQIELVDESYSPLPGVTLEREISWLDSEGEIHKDMSTIRLDDNGRFLQKWKPKHHGPHSIKVTDKKGQVNEDRFLVQSLEEEMSHLEPNGQLLASISSGTGGNHFTDQLNLKQLALRKSPSKETVSRLDKPLWDHPALLVLILSLLLGEWFLRKRIGIT